MNIPVSAPCFLLSSPVVISAGVAVCLVDGNLWLKLLPVLCVDTGDGAAGIFQQNLVAYDLQYDKTAILPIVINAPDNRSLIGVLFHVHLEVPLLVL